MRVLTAALAALAVLTSANPLPEAEVDAVTKFHSTPGVAEMLALINTTTVERISPSECGNAPVPWGTFCQMYYTSCYEADCNDPNNPCSVTRPVHCINNNCITDPMQNYCRACWYGCQNPASVEPQ